MINYEIVNFNLWVSCDKFPKEHFSADAIFSIK